MQKSVRLRLSQDDKLIGDIDVSPVVPTQRRLKAVLDVLLLVAFAAAFLLCLYGVLYTLIH